MTRKKKRKGSDFMPRGDKTGPMGKGPRTGRGKGSCKKK